jgi:hypothetical protein
MCGRSPWRTISGVAASVSAAKCVISGWLLACLLACVGAYFVWLVAFMPDLE